MNGDIVVMEKCDTQILAEKIAEKMESDLFHIEKDSGYHFTYKGMVENEKDE